MLKVDLGSEYPVSGYSGIALLFRVPSFKSRVVNFVIFCVCCAQAHLVDVVEVPVNTVALQAAVTTTAGTAEINPVYNEELC
jgi:hypothetical protein